MNSSIKSSLGLGNLNKQTNDSCIIDKEKWINALKLQMQMDCK